ncbi:MAG: hypothetical protein AAF999_15135, partial [Pseudomonadota bacterium]
HLRRSGPPSVRNSSDISMQKLPRKNTRAGIADQKLKGKVGSKHRLRYIEGSRFFRDETFATEESELTNFLIELPELTNLVFTNQDASDLDFGRLVRFIDVAPIGVEITPDGDLVTIFGEIDDGLLSVDNLVEGSIAPFDNAPNQFLNNFDNSFAADLSSVLSSETLLDATTVLSEETVTLLTDDIFDFA